MIEEDGAAIKQLRWSINSTRHKSGCESSWRLWEPLSSNYEVIGESIWNVDVKLVKKYGQGRVGDGGETRGWGEERPTLPFYPLTYNEIQTTTLKSMHIQQLLSRVLGWTIFFFDNNGEPFSKWSICYVANVWFMTKYKNNFEIKVYIGIKK